MQTVCNIVVRGGLYYVADFVDRHGFPRVPNDAPGFPSRGEAETWATKQADAPEAEVEFNEENIEAALADAPDLSSGNVTVEVPTGSATATGQEPEAKVDEG